MKQILVVTVIAVILSAIGAANLNGADSEFPNIVVFLVDDMGVMDTSVPFLTNAAGKPKRFPLNDYLPHTEHGAAGGARNSVQQFLCDERLLADSHLNHDRAERRPARRDQLDQSPPEQSRHARSSAVELDGTELR